MKIHVLFVKKTRFRPSKQTRTSALMVLLTLLLVATGGTWFYRKIQSQTLTAYAPIEDMVADIPASIPTAEQPPAFVPTFANVTTLRTMEDLQKHLYVVDPDAYVTEQDLNVQAFLTKNFKTNMHTESPKVLIFHTHSQETFKDSRPGFQQDTIVGMGQLLAETLVKEYGIQVVHDIGVYDIRDGKDQRAESYQNMEPAVKKILEKYPTVEIAIDLHRDGVPDNIRLVTDIEGKPTAKVMFFNGMTKIRSENGPKETEDLVNPYIQDNLALSLQMQLTANELFPGFARKIYLKPYRYSLHLLPKSLLVEVGANTNTVEEARNAMAPLAKIIAKVFVE